jgi:secondary thiamine-phosphate synthase enzyme
MKVYKDSINFKTSKGISFIDITEKISDIVSNSKVTNGIVFLFAPHATGAIIINEYESRLLIDIRKFLEKLIPINETYEHPENAPSHILSSFFRPSLVVPLTQCSLQLGTWQSIIWVEVEPWSRNRDVYITIIGE